MNTGQLKEMLADVGDDFPVLVKTADGWKHVTIAYEEILWTEKTPLGVETEAFFLELVTPVEELEPYALEEETAYIDEEECSILHIYYNYNEGRDKVRTFYENGTESWNATKAAAEAERDRLNAKYRKEQSNG